MAEGKDKLIDRDRISRLRIREMANLILNNWSDGVIQYSGTKLLVQWPLCDKVHK